MTRAFEILASRPGRRTLPWLCMALAALLAGCAALEPPANRPESHVLRDTAGTALGRGIAPLVSEHPGLSGIYLLQDGPDAFAARALLAAAAQRTLDVQYYIWHPDLSGKLLLQALHAAAERGVRVRLLLDDNNTGGMDAMLAALDQHARIEVRLFNPFRVRSLRPLGYVTEFSRLNRRMHNKSFTADNQATIVGGRNVGDEYFGAGDGMLFADLDVLAIGPVVDAVSSDFDRYWASASSYPASQLLTPAAAGQLQEVSQNAAQAQRDPAAQAYVQALREATFVRRMVEGTLAFEWAPTQLVSDDPAKVLSRASQKDLLLPRLKQLLQSPAESMELVSPYFVPTADGVKALVALRQQGVRIRVLTNSLEATDVAAVHAGYAKRRQDLLEAGVTLYELKRQPLQTASAKGHGLKLKGSSSASLHAKTFSVDRSRLFVGSLNFDPRSAALNTEMGLLIHSPRLAAQVDDALDRVLPTLAYQVVLPEGEGARGLRWLSQDAQGQPVVDATEPGTSWWQRAGVGLMSLLPIEWLL
ncbi:MAG: phospholipase D family protein [Polaromonas sp.]